MPTDLATLRGLLNDELGLASDSDDKPFGAAAVRNQALVTTLQRLWPRVAMLITEDITGDPATMDYDLVDVWDILAIELLIDGATVAGPKQAISKYRSYRNEWDEGSSARLTLFTPLRTGHTLRVIGWQPYAVPDVDNEASETDVPELMLPVITAGARAYLYRAKMNQYANFERFQNTNRSTTLSVEQMLALWSAAEREYADGMHDWQRGASEPKTANFR